MDKSGTGVLVRDGLGKDANEWFKMEPKKRQGWRSGTLDAPLTGLMESNLR